MKSQAFVTGAATLLLFIGPLADAGSAKSADGCAGGYSDPGLVAYAPALALPRITSGLTAGEYTAAELAVQFNLIDGNDDGFICLKANSNLRGNSGRTWSFYYGAQDNRH